MRSLLMERCIIRWESPYWELFYNRLPKSILKAGIAETCGVWAAEDVADIEQTGDWWEY